MSRRSALERVGGICDADHHLVERWENDRQVLWRDKEEHAKNRVDLYDPVRVWITYIY
jgi:hypothetical protein